MTNQIQGEILFKGINYLAGTPEWVFSPWVAVRGDKATFGIEVLQITASTSIYWGVDTRTKASSSVTSIVTTRTVSAVGVDLITLGSTDVALELVRYRFATANSAGSDAAKWAVLRALDPSWQGDR